MRIQSSLVSKSIPGHNCIAGNGTLCPEPTPVPLVQGWQPGGTSSYAQAPARTITVGGVTYAYRELGPKGGIPVVFFVHLAANLDNWDPGSSTPSPPSTTSSPSTTAASEPPLAPFQTASRRWPTTPRPSSRRSASTRSTSSPSPSAA